MKFAAGMESDLREAAAAVDRQAASLAAPLAALIEEIDRRCYLRAREFGACRNFCQTPFRTAAWRTGRGRGAEYRDRLSP
jgi:hypothetical protein